MKSTDSTTEIDPMAVIVTVHERLTRMVDDLEHQSERDVDTMKAIARLSESLIKLSGEARQLQKQKRRDLTTYSDSEVIAHILTLSERRQEEFRIALSPDDIAKRPLY